MTSGKKWKSTALYAPPLQGNETRDELVSEVQGLLMRTKGRKPLNLTNGFTVYLRNAFMKKHDYLGRNNEIALLSNIRGTEEICLLHHKSQAFNKQIVQPSLQARVAGLTAQQCNPADGNNAEIRIKLVMTELDGLLGGGLFTGHNERDEVIRGMVDSVTGVLNLTAGPVAGVASKVIEAVYRLISVAGDNDEVLAHEVEFSIGPDQDNLRFPHPGYYVFCQSKIDTSKVSLARLASPYLVHQNGYEVQSTDYFVLEVVDYYTPPVSQVEKRELSDLVRDIVHMQPPVPQPTPREEAAEVAEVLEANDEDNDDDGGDDDDDDDDAKADDDDVEADVEAGVEAGVEATAKNGDASDTDSAEKSNMSNSQSQNSPNQSPKQMLPPASNAMYAPPLKGTETEATSHCLLQDLKENFQSRPHVGAAGFKICVRNVFMTQHDKSWLSSKNEVSVMTRVLGTDKVTLHHLASHQYYTQTGQPNKVVEVARFPSSGLPASQAQPINIKVMLVEVDKLLRGGFFANRSAREQALRELFDDATGLLKTKLRPDHRAHVGVALDVFRSVAKLISHLIRDDDVITRTLDFTLGPKHWNIANRPNPGFYVFSREPMPLGRVELHRTDEPEVYERGLEEHEYKKTDYIVLEVVDL